MDAGFVNLTARTIMEQLFWSIDKWTYFSWGCSRKVAMVYNNMATLALRVSGLVHKGWVYISLDEGTDTYTVTLLNTRKNVKRVMTDVYCDNLGAIIDSLVEKPTAMTEEEYSKKSMADSMKKICR